MLWQASCPTCGLHCRFEHSSSDFYRFDYVRALLEALLCEISNLLLRSIEASENKVIEVIKVHIP